MICENSTSAAPAPYDLRRQLSQLLARVLLCGQLRELVALSSLPKCRAHFKNEAVRLTIIAP